MKITQVYIPYWEWEDFINGMWRKVTETEESEFLTQAMQFTGDDIKYGQAMRDVIKAWPKTMLNSMTNYSINKRAFLGHCACCFSFGCPEYIVRMAWKGLTDEQRRLADKVAQETINKWMYEYAESNTIVYKNLGGPVLF